MTFQSRTFTHRPRNDFYQTTIRNQSIWNNQKFVLFHYPIAEWADYYKGAIHLHGHQHNTPAYNIQQAEAGIRRYDVGVDANDFKPVSIDAIEAFVHF